MDDATGDEMKSMFQFHKPLLIKMYRSLYQLESAFAHAKLTILNPISHLADFRDME